MDEGQIEVEVLRGTTRCAKSASPLVCAAEITIELIDHQSPKDDALEVGRRILETIKANELKSAATDSKT